MKRKRGKFFTGAFVGIPIAIMNTPAWRAMGCTARVLWIELRRKLSYDGSNNASSSNVILSEESSC